MTLHLVMSMHTITAKEVLKDNMFIKANTPPYKNSSNYTGIKWVHGILKLCICAWELAECGRKRKGTQVLWRGRHLRLWLEGLTSRIFEVPCSFALCSFLRSYLQQGCLQPWNAGILFSSSLAVYLCPHWVLILFCELCCYLFSPL